MKNKTRDIKNYRRNETNNAELEQKNYISLIIIESI